MPKALQRHENVQKQNLIHKTQWIELDSTQAFKSRPCFSIQKWKYVHVKLISTQIMMIQRYLYLKDFLDNRKLCACAHDADVDSYWTRLFFFISVFSTFLFYGMIITLKYNPIWHRLSASNPNWGAGGRRQQFGISLIPLARSKLSLPNRPKENSTVFSTLG